MSVWIAAMAVDISGSFFISRSKNGTKSAPEANRGNEKSNSTANNLPAAISA